LVLIPGAPTDAYTDEARRETDIRESIVRCEDLAHWTVEKRLGGMGFLLSGREFALATSKLYTPLCSDHRLYVIGVGASETVSFDGINVRGPEDLRGLVRVASQASALTYARIFTDEPTRSYIEPRYPYAQWYEVVPTEWVETNGSESEPPFRAEVQPNGSALIYCQGGHVLPMLELSMGIGSPSISVADGGYDVVRYVWRVPYLPRTSLIGQVGEALGNTGPWVPTPDPPQTILKVREFVGVDGELRREILQEVPVPKDLGVVLVQ